MSLKEGIKILKEQIDKQLEFIEWLKTKGLYNEMDAAYTMQKMHEVWQAMKEDTQ